MKIRLAMVVLALLATISAVQAGQPYRVGLRHLGVPAPERGGTLEVTLWYPSTAAAASELVGETAIFKGVAVQPGAPMIAGRLPLVLLAHGGMRAAPELGDWLAAGLAARGYAVALPRQPDPARLSPREAPRELWLRPADLTATLSALQGDAVLAARLDANRVAAVGVFLGGTTALALAGARLDAARYALSCDRGAPLPDCAWYAKAGVDLHALDPAQVGHSSLDRRIRLAVAVAPELSTSFSAASLAAIAVPVRLVDLGSGSAPAMSASGLARAIPQARYEVVPGATAFSAFPECKPQGAAILREGREDEALCQEDGGRARAAIHDRILGIIDAALRAGPGRGS
jgi:predicted dienelactone hydrolase